MSTNRNKSWMKSIAKLKTPWKENPQWGLFRIKCCNLIMMTILQNFRIINWFHQKIWTFSIIGRDVSRFKVHLGSKRKNLNGRLQGYIWSQAKWPQVWIHTPRFGAAANTIKNRQFWKNGPWGQIQEIKGKNWKVIRIYP